jgi:hypothetical protein
LYYYPLGGTRYACLLSDFYWTSAYKVYVYHYSYFKITIVMCKKNLETDIDVKFLFIKTL